MLVMLKTMAVDGIAAVGIVENIFLFLKSDLGCITQPRSDYLDC
jgi:hypothetical protein